MTHIDFDSSADDDDAGGEYRPNWGPLETAVGRLVRKGKLAPGKPFLDWAEAEKLDAGPGYLRERVWLALAEDPDCPGHLLEQLDTLLALPLARNRMSHELILTGLAVHPVAEVARAVAENPNVSLATLEVLAERKHDWDVVLAVVQNREVSLGLLRKLQKHEHRAVASAATVALSNRSMNATG